MKLTILFTTLLPLLMLSLIGCGSSSTKSSCECAICINEVPEYPSDSAESCAAFAATQYTSDVHIRRRRTHQTEQKGQRAPGAAPILSSFRAQTGLNAPSCHLTWHEDCSVREHGLPPPIRNHLR